MVGLFVEGWYPSEEKAVMNIPLFTLAASLLTMAFPILMLLSGKYTSFVPWLTLLSAVLIGVALLSTFSQRRVLILHRGVHVGVVYFALAILFAFMDRYSPYIGLLFCVLLFIVTFRVANKTSAGYGVQFRREWDAKRLLKLQSKRLGHWNIVNAKASNGLMAVSRTKQQLAVLYCTFDDEGCWLHLDVFSEQIFDLDGFLIEDA